MSRGRLVDVVLALSALVVLSPVLAAVAIAVWSTSGSPVLYRAERVGRGGRTFRLLKFRTMVRDQDPAAPRLTRAGDPRVTPVGRWLRRWKLDELPQLVNVVKGEMRLVGPRPEDPRYIAFYSPEQRELLDLAPGLTSRASMKYAAEESLLTGPDWEETYVRRVLPAKLEIELEYERRRTVRSDLGVLLETAWSIVRRGSDRKAT